MIQKLCPHCLRNSYSAYDNPRWICPYCGADMGNKLPNRRTLTARVVEFERTKQEGD